MENNRAQAFESFFQTFGIITEYHSPRNQFKKCCCAVAALFVLAVVLFAIFFLLHLNKNIGNSSATTTNPMISTKNPSSATISTTTTAIPKTEAHDKCKDENVNEIENKIPEKSKVT